MRQSSKRTKKSIFAMLLAVLMTASTLVTNGLTVNAEEMQSDAQIVMPEGSALQQNSADDSFVPEEEVYDYGYLGTPAETYDMPRVQSKGFVSKKGLQGANLIQSEYQDLGVKHTLYNCNLLDIIGTKDDHYVEYEYNGKTYYFNYINGLATQAHQFNEAGIDITVVLLLPYRAQYANMIYAGARGDTGRTYYAWNLDDPESRELFEAILNFLAETYSVKNGDWNEMYIKNWVLGNEVNMPNHWNYTGTLDLNTNVSLYARQYKLLSEILEKHARKYNADMKAYISIEHSWTHDDDGRGIAGKTFIDTFAAKLAEIAPGMNWNLAYHPYPAIMTDSNIWSSGYTTKDITTPFISGYNLDVLTRYIKNTYGRDKRIILSEQGFTVTGGQEAKQAAALAYTYYMAEFDDMIDAAIFRSLNDTPAEAAQGFQFGLLNNNGTKRPSYDVFKYMDTEQWQGYTAACLSTMEKSSWNEIVPGFNPGKFSYTPVSSIVLSKTNTTIAAGYTDILKADILPETAWDTDLSWSSSNPSVAQVDGNGKVTGTGIGTAVITAQCAGVTAECTVTVVSEDTIKPQVDAFVQRIYQNVLNRTPSEQEVNAWSAQLMNHNDCGAIVGYGFVFSAECINRGLSNADFVEILYNTFLNRASDEGGKNAWASQLDAGVDREMVFSGFALSAEFNQLCQSYGIEAGNFAGNQTMTDIVNHYRNRNADITKFVARCYTEAMGRQYDVSGLEGWCKAIIEKNNTPKQVAQSFIFSEEFVDKNLSDEEYVKVLYKTFMGREADEGGLAGWTEVLASGREDRAKVLEGFSDSVEFAGILELFGLN